MKASNVDRLGVIRRCPLVLSMSSAGQKKLISSTKKCGEPITPRSALMPVGVYRLHRVQAGGEADGSGDAVELILLRDVATFFEERVPQGEAHAFAESDVPVVGGRSQAKRGKRRWRKRMGVEGCEQVGRDLAAERVDLFGDQAGVEIGTVHEFERPGADSQADIYSSQRALLNEPPQPDVRERAPHVCEHLDGLHVKMICPPAAFS